MNAALFFLATRSAWNAVLSRLRRLRQPKYAIGILVGAAYFYWIFTGPMRGGSQFGRRPSRVVEMATLMPAEMLDLVALALLFFVLISAWILPGSRAALTFSEAELAFLFPGPVSRQALVRYKLLQAQIGLFLLALVFTFISGRFNRSGLALVHTAGWWLVLCTLQIHRLAASFTLTRLYTAGLSDLKRRLAALGVLAALVGLVVAWRASTPGLPPINREFFEGGWIDYVRQVLQAGPAPWLLAPFRWLAAPYFATDALSFAKAAAPALGLLALHYWWVMRADVAFEEASIVQSQKVAELAAARREGLTRPKQSPKNRRVPLFPLPPAGLAWVSLAWKQLLQVGGLRTVRLYGALAVAGIVLVLALARTSFRPGITGVAISLACMGLLTSLVLLPLINGRALQNEMSAGDAAKAWPLPGWQLALGQLLAPAFLGAALQVVCFVLLAAVLPPRAYARPELWLLPLALLPLLPMLNLLLSVVPAAAPLLFPGWFRPGEQAGIEATGVRIISFLGQVLFSALALVPVLLATGAAYFAAALFFGPLGTGLAALGTAAVLLAVEALGGIVLLGSLVERFDPTES